MASFLVFVIWLTYELHKSKKKEQAILSEFWQKEEEANNVRKKSLDGLSYITIPFERLPLDTALENEDIRHIHEKLRALSTEKIVNLTGISNTDLKLTYGTANITPLTQYDQNYTLLASTVYSWGELLYKEGFIDQAKQVLEFGLETGTDVSGNYKLLAKIYHTEGSLDKLSSLREKAQGLDSIMKTTILQALEEISQSETGSRQ
ncbi:MAG: hypothetical protein J6P60_01080 [Lachnospiraceae bacterium]|nr:hypothetical protein [Lachnospiraceae bacterium]